MPDEIKNAGTGSLSSPDISPLPFVFNYTNTSVVEAFERIMVPAGSFNSLRARDTLHCTMADAMRGLDVGSSFAGR